MSIEALPFELIDHAFFVGNPSIVEPAFLVCKKWNLSRERLLENIWNDLKELALKNDCPILEKRMTQLEQGNQTKYINLFRRLYQIYGPNRQPPKLMEIQQYFFDRQKEEDADNNLRIFWSMITSQGNIEPFLSLDAPKGLNAQEIRAWVASEENQAKLNEITSINLMKCNLTLLPPEIAMFPNLEIIWLNHNHLKVIPVEVGQLHKLQELDLGENNISCLPPFIGSLMNLKKLRIPHNNLKTLPSQLGNLIDLKVLDCLNNQLISVPSELGYLEKLEKFYLGKNQLTSLPSELGNLKRLNRFKLEKNFLSISSLPEEILDLKPKGLKKQRKEVKKLALH